jgi:uncharacterized protein (TIGR03382 family)
MTSNVNLNDTCNAYYDGQVNFYHAGGGCNNTGEIADVNYHEWGHGFHYWSMESGSYDGSLGEGAADVVAFFQTHDSVIAPYFETNGSGIREVSTNRVYPEDYINSDYYVHSNGLIFGGSIWDLWNLLVEAEGDEDGTWSATQIYAGLLKGGPTVETSYDEAVVADDDDGDLSNGTPHFCDIIDAFAQHGLGPTANGGSVTGLLHDPVVEAVAGEASPVSVSYYNMASSCFTYTPQEAWLTYRVNDGDWQTTDLTLGTESATGSIPAMPEGAFIEYYVSLEDDEGGVLAAPTGEAINPFSFYVGGVLPVYCETFEESDGGYRHELVAGGEELGADDWQWGRPNGEAHDPASAYSGDYIWGNDLGDGDYNGEYQNEKTNRLTSPVIDTAHYQGTFVDFRRWLNVEDARYDHARVLADGQEIWSNWSSSSGEEHHQDGQWAPQAIDLLENGDDGSVELAWEIETDEGLTMGGWNIDDVCVYAPATPDNRLGITDFQAGDDEEGGVTLTWTSPRHLPIDRVVVVRSESAFPAGPTDGSVVYEDGAPEVETPMSVRDETAEGGVQYYYAVFASDGTDWLSYSTEGVNADRGNALDGQTGVTQDPPDEDTASGCGCASSSAGPWGPVGLLLASLAVLRRRSASARA